MNTDKAYLLGLIIMASTSRILDPRIIGQEHFEVARGVQEILQKYKELQDIIAILSFQRFFLLPPYGQGAYCRHKGYGR